MALAGFSTLDLCTSAPLPGAGKIEYAPVDTVDAAEWERAVLLPDYNQQKDIHSGTWYTLPYAGGTAQWTEDQQDDEQGAYFRINLSALLPADSAVVRGELDAMRRHRYLLRLTRSGRIYLLGALEQPLRFDSRFDSGAQGADTRGHRCSFSGVSITKSPGYVPEF